MAERKGSKFPVSFRVACRPETGEEFVLYTDRELEEQRKAQMADFEQELAARQGAGERPDSFDALRKAVAARLDAGIERAKADRDAAMPYAELHEFTLVKPTWGEHMRSLGEANVLDETTGAVRFDENLYALAVLPESVDGLTAAEVKNLSPTVAGELTARLLRAISPNRNRLPFASSGPGTS